MPELILGLNTSVTLLEADAYLDGSARAGARWPTFTDDQKKRALISAFRILDRQRWNGEAVEGLRVVTGFSIVAGGSLWAVSDEAEIDGTALHLARLTVLTLSADAIATARLTDAGLYTVDPAGPITAVPPSTGTGASLSLILADNPSSFPRTGLVDCDGNELDAESYPVGFQIAQMELAFDIASNPAAEISGGIGSNLKRVKADAVEAEFFRPTGGADGAGSARFPSYILDHIGCLLAGNTLTASFYGGSFGTGATSVVADPNEFGLTIE